MSFSWFKSTLSSYIYRDKPPDDSLKLTTDDILTLDAPSNSSTSNTTTTTTTTTTSVQSSVQGLENLGNTCFFNASVQALLACPKFVEYITILSASHKQNTSHSEYTPYEPLPSKTANTMEENKIFCELLVDLYSGDITSPKHLFSQLCAFHPTEFSSFTQSDAHESFNKMMEILEIEQLYIATESQSENVINNMFEFLDNKQDDNEYKYEYKNNINEMDIQNIKNPFDGLLGNMVECMECKYINQSKQTSFRCLTLSLSDDMNHMNNGYDTLPNIFSVKLTDRIDAFEKQEQIDGYRCIMCEYKGIINQIKHKLNELNGKDKKQINEIEMNVLNEQYCELNDKLNKLLINNNDNNGYVLGIDNSKILNGYNGYGMYGNNNNNNGFLNGNNNINNTQIIHITNKEKKKYEIDIGLNKLYRVKAKKKQFVSRYPNVLCIHLNRLQFGCKDSRYVSFKPLLSLNNNIKEINCSNGMFNDSDYQLLSQYILMSVIVHHGNDLGGHYTTYKRKINIKNIYKNQLIGNELEWKSLDELQLIEKNSEWYHISDQFVNKVTINDILTSKAYMLFYQKNQFKFNFHLRNT